MESTNKNNDDVGCSSSSSNTPPGDERTSSTATGIAAENVQEERPELAEEVDLSLSLAPPNKTNQGGEANAQAQGQNPEEPHNDNDEAQVQAQAQAQAQAQDQDQAQNVPAQAEEVVVKSCLECGATQTPLWRRGPMGMKTLCNACGLRYWKEERVVSTKLTLGFPP